MKKFKEYRTFLLCLVLFIIFLSFGIYALIQNSLGQAIGGLLLGFVALLLMTARYKMILFDDGMMIYEWKIAAFLPTFISYSDIQSIQKKSKHHIIVQHHKTSHIYVFNSEAFLQAFQELKKSA